jgi:hypothetical protein
VGAGEPEEDTGDLAPGLGPGWPPPCSDAVPPEPLRDRALAAGAAAGPAGRLLTVGEYPGPAENGTPGGPPGPAACGGLNSIETDARSR